jgi:hypothetical protein
MTSLRLSFAVVLSVVLLGFQLPALAADKPAVYTDADVQAREDLGEIGEHLKEAADLSKQAADLSEENDPTKNGLKVISLINEARDKVDQARSIALAGPLTPEQHQGLVVGYGDRDGDGKHDPSHPDNLREATQNPVASLISVPLESNFNFDVGPEGNTQYVMNAKPVIPMNINEDWNFINRAIQPIIVQDNLTNSPSGDLETDSSIFGLGDLTYQGFLTPKKAEKVIWGVGGVLVVPWGEDGLSSEKWQAGPAAVALTKKGKWVFGSVISQQWDFAGRGSAEDVSLAIWQYFINYNMKKGWFLTSSPTMSANWEADKTGDRLTVPFGGGIGKLFKMGGHPYRASVQAFGYATTPDSVDTNWTLQAEFRLLFPK